ncbi:XF1762 family protein [Vibrio navarrensis]|uniref:XF1762 family protein n=1 Tax=Vibrio navarrensis TaxID=29495 RepID=UPI00186994E0|nr:XF1762 family protein [Vibrio navarrensis]
MSKLKISRTLAAYFFLIRLVDTTIFFIFNVMYRKCKSLTISMSKSIFTQPITIKLANEFVKEHHRHHRPTTRNTGKWALSAIDLNGDVIGVLIAGNPVSATYMDGVTLEITRLCVKQSAPKGTCSFLISKCSKIWGVMGGERIITYTLDEESGASMRGAGWKKVGTVQPHNRWTNKNKVDGIQREKLEIYSRVKIRWEYKLKDAS